MWIRDGLIVLLASTVAACSVPVLAGQGLPSAPAASDVLPSALAQALRQ
jgi:hypothetical protein